MCFNWEKISFINSSSFLDLNVYRKNIYLHSKSCLSHWTVASNHAFIVESLTLNWQHFYFINQTKIALLANTKAKIFRFVSCSSGYYTSLKIKGFGRRTWKTTSLLWFKLGHSHRIYNSVPRIFSYTITRKRSLLKFFSPYGVNLHAFMERIRWLKPTFSYKDTGIRYLTARPRLRKRRISSY